jgi:hypothetical protein
VVAPAPARPEAPAEEEEETTVAGLEPEPAGPLAGLLPFDLKPLQDSADAFFERLARLGEACPGESLLSLGPWLVVAGVAAAELALLPALWRNPPPALPGIEFSNEEEQHEC